MLVPDKCLFSPAHGLPNQVLSRRNYSENKTGNEVFLHPQDKSHVQKINTGIKNANQRMFSGMAYIIILLNQADEIV